MECMTVEYRGELVVHAPVVESDGAVDVRGLSVPECVYARLDSNRTPRLVERSVEPEACLVAEEDDSSRSCGFFLIAGNLTRLHAACWARSAFAKRLRGRCSEKPS